MRATTTHASQYLRCSVVIVIIDAMEVNEGMMSALSGQISVVYQTHTQGRKCEGEDCNILLIC